MFAEWKKCVRSCETLFSTVSEVVSEVRKCVCRYKGYRSIDMATRECIVEKGMALRDVMVDIANNLNIPHTCHAFHKDNVWDYRYVTSPHDPCSATRIVVDRTTQKCSIYFSGQ